MQAAAPIDVYVEQVKVIHVGPVHYESTIHQYVRTGRQGERQTDGPTDRLTFKLQHLTRLLSLLSLQLVIPIDK